MVATALVAGRMAPVITCSSVTGEVGWCWLAVCGSREHVVDAVCFQGLDRIRALLNKLQPRAVSVRAKAGADSLEDASALVGGAAASTSDKDKPESKGEASVAAVAASSDLPHVQIDSVFQVVGVGTVVAGSVLSGTITAGDTLLLGPDVTGQFIPVTVRTIHVQYTPSHTATVGGTAAFAIRPKGKIDAKKVRRVACCVSLRAGCSHCVPGSAGLGEEGHVFSPSQHGTEGVLGVCVGNRDFAPPDHHGPRLLPRHAHRCCDAIRKDCGHQEFDRRKHGCPADRGSCPCQVPFHVPPGVHCARQCAVVP
jgi:hypothetical protein